MIAGGTAVGTSLGLTTAGAAGQSGQPVEVAATEPYLSAVRDAAGTDDAPAVAVRPMDDLDELPDVRISGRPVADGDAARAVAVQGWAALAHPKTGWRECQRRSVLRAHWAGDEPVETWTETDWTSVGARDDLTQAVGRPGAAGARFVRGTRAYQYDRGHGGAGYYSVGAAELEALPADPSRYTPVARLAYLHVDEGALSDDRVSSFLRQYDRRTDSVEDVATRFVDPAFGN